MRITDGPRLAAATVQAGEIVKVTTSAVAINEEWVGFFVDWGDGKTLQDTGSTKAYTRTYEHTYTTPGSFTIRVTAFHGWKSGQRNVGPYKLRQTRGVKVRVAPTLPMRVGALTINANKIERISKKKPIYRISDTVTVNGVILLDNPIVVDLEKNEVQVSGALNIVGAGAFSRVLSMASNVTIDATTGAFKSADIPSVAAEFELSGFAVKIEKFKIIAGGVQFDFEMKVPRLARGVSNPCDAGGGLNSDASPGELISIKLQAFQITTRSPYLHFGGTVSTSVKNLTIPGTSWGLSELTVGFEVVPKEKFFGTIVVCLPSERSVGASVEFLNGEFNKLGFQVGPKIPIYTFTGIGDAVTISQVSAEVGGLATGEVPVIAMGTIGPGNLVAAPGVQLQWNVGIPAGGLAVTPFTLNGAANFDADWNMAAAGNLILFEKPALNVSQVFGRYVYQKGGGTWTLGGQLNLIGLVSLGATFSTSFNAADAYVKGVARGTVALPAEHWAAKYVPSGKITADAVVYYRATPQERAVAAVRGIATLPVIGERFIGFAIDLKTATPRFGIDKKTLAELMPGKAAVVQETIAGGAGADGVIVELTFDGAQRDFNIRFPDGSLVTPAQADDVTIAYRRDARSAVYIFDVLPDGDYAAEFDDSGLGDWSIEFFTVPPQPAVTPTIAAGDVSVARYETFDVDLAVAGFADGDTVRVYVDDDTEWGGGFLVGEGTVVDGAVAAAPLSADAGTYNLYAEAEAEAGVPTFGYAAETVTVRDYATLASLKGAIVDSTKPGKDKIKLKATLRFDGAAPQTLFDPADEDLDLAIGGESAAYRLTIPAGDPGWKVSGNGSLSWKSAKGALPKIKVKIVPKKGQIVGVVAKVDLIAAPANPMGLDFRFGNDHAVLRGAATESKPGRFKLKLTAER